MGWRLFLGTASDERITGIVSAVIDIGSIALSLADSTGMANPNSIKWLLEKVLPICNNTPLVLHLHDTRGLGLANAIAAMEMGVNQFDTAFGGLGGCPFIKGATGNIATEDIVNMMNELEIETGVDMGKVAKASKTLQKTVPESYFTGKLYKLEN